MEKLSLFLMTFLFIYLIYLFAVIINKKKIEKFKEGSQFIYFKNIYKLNPESINMKKFINDIGLANAFIMSLTVIIIDYTDKLIIKMVAGFLILIPLIIGIYHIIGKKYQKKANITKEGKHV